LFKSLFLDPSFIFYLRDAHLLQTPPSSGSYFPLHFLSHSLAFCLLDCAFFQNKPARKSHSESSAGLSARLTTTEQPDVRRHR
jgi:hypothetical protein